MAIVIPVAVEGMRVANRAGVVAQRKSVAVQLADSLLSELIVTGSWQDAALTGTFSPQYPDYQWRVQNESWGRDAMRMVSVEVTYEVQNQTYNVLLSTLAPPVN